MDKRFTVIQGGKQTETKERALIVEFQLLDASWNPTGPVVEFSVGQNGIVDLSNHPDPAIANTWKSLGLPDEVRNGQVYPEDGKRFLTAILRSGSSQCWKATVKKT